MFAFLSQTFRRFHDTGAIAPSSRWLGRALAAPLTERGEEPIAILEAGPGTGAVTREIVRHLQPVDHLTLCEINPVFVEHLRERFESDPRLRPHRDRVDIVQSPVESLEGEGCFDHIVCGLPFNNFDPEQVREIFSVFQRLLRPGGTVNFFEYAAIRGLKALLVTRAERERLRGVASVLGEVIEAHERRRKLVLVNLPPAWARCLVMGER
ncbi:methyltransferase domain-containing protein [Candidatus Sumerlaeota bacterium]|nr:methyltransferase domain-containing protein [Candidatus Sumerlaeota bacterium]